MSRNEQGLTAETGILKGGEVYTQLNTVDWFIFAWLNFCAFSFEDHSRYS